MAYGFHCHRRRCLCLQNHIRSGHDYQCYGRHDFPAVLAGAAAFAQNGRLQHQIAKAIAPVWFLTTTEDLRWPKVKLRGARPNPCLPLLRSYLDLVLFSAIIDPKIAMAYFKVYILATTPSSLVRPRMVSRILVAATKRAVKRLVRRKEDSVFALSSEVLSSLRDRTATSMIDA